MILYIYFGSSKKGTRMKSWGNEKAHDDGEIRHITPHPSTGFF